MVTKEIDSKSAAVVKGIKQRGTLAEGRKKNDRPATGGPRPDCVPGPTCRGKGDCNEGFRTAALRRNLGKSNQKETEGEKEPGKRQQLEKQEI